MLNPDKRRRPQLQVQALAQAEVGLQNICGQNIG